MSAEIPLMVNKTTSMEKLISYPFYESTEGNYLTRKPSITYVKSFLNKFFSEMVNDKLKSPLSDTKRSEKVEEEFVPQQISLPSKTFLLMNTENIKELKDDNEIPDKIESESELGSSKSYVSQSSESEIIISHYAGKLCAVLFYAEIRNLVKKQIRKTLKENIGPRLKNRNDISVDIKRYKEIQKDEKIIISEDLVAVKEDLDINVNHDNILDKTRLEIRHIIKNNNKEYQDFKRRKTIGKEKNNKEIKNSNNFLKIQRLEMYKGNVLVPSTITIFKRPFLRKLFLKKKLKALDSRNVVSQKNKSINRNKILKKRISIKNEGAQYHPYSKSIDNKAWVVETTRQGNRIGTVDEVSVEL